MATAGASVAGAGGRVLTPYPVLDVERVTALVEQHGIKPMWLAKLYRALVTHPALQAPAAASPAATAGSTAASTTASTSDHAAGDDDNEHANEHADGTAWTAALEDTIWNDLATTIPSLPVRLIPLLRAHTTLLSSRVVLAQRCATSGTTKLIVELQDGKQVECVIIHYRGKTTSGGGAGTTGKYYPSPATSIAAATTAASAPSASASDTFEDHDFEFQDEDNTPASLPLAPPPAATTAATTTTATTATSHARTTLCVSSQVGCKMACTFCATGTMGLLANLTAGEILEQVVHARRLSPIRNIVFMGQGEPLDNYANVLAALRTLTDRKCFQIAPQHLTLSTVGVVPRMLQLVHDIASIQLAVSLHAPNQALRERLVPSGRSYKIEQIMDAIDRYIAGSGKRVLIQYTLIRDTNDSMEHARELAELLLPRHPRIMVNVIPYNPTEVFAEFHAPERERVLQFASALRRTGLLVTVRQEMGQSVDGACGQLALKVGKTGASSAASCAAESNVADIEDLGRRKSIQAAASSPVNRRRGGGGARAVVRYSTVDAQPDGTSSSSSSAAATAATAPSQARSATEDESRIGVGVGVGGEGPQWRLVLAAIIMLVALVFGWLVRPVDG